MKNEERLLDYFVIELRLRKHPLKIPLVEGCPKGGVERNGQSPQKRTVKLLDKIKSNVYDIKIHAKIKDIFLKQFQVTESRRLVKERTLILRFLTF